MSIKIFTEEPEQDLWRELLQYSYKSNIRRYFEERGFQIDENTNSNNNFDVLANAIAGALLQADEYYKASKSVSLHVEPLMLYYGTTNLLYAMSILITGEAIKINNHGMRIEVDANLRHMADTKVKFFGVADGGVHIFAKNLGFDKDLCYYGQGGPDGKDCWTLGDYLDSIAEICGDFNRCYAGRKSHVLMLDVVKTTDGIVEKISIEKDEEIDIDKIEEFSKAYLIPSIGHTLEGKKHLVLRRKLGGKTIEQNSYSGQPYLRIAHEISGKMITLPEELNLYISLFVLGNLCRYYPEKWYPFVAQDSTGEKLLIEKLLYYSRRMLPNIVLNRIEGQSISFVSDKYVPDDRIRLVGDHEVKEIVQTEVKKQIREQQISNSVHIRRQ